MDLSTRTHEERRMQKIPIFGQLWIEHWASYGWRFGHRGISHWPVIGTLTRLFWIVKPIIWMALILALLVWGDVIYIGWVDKPGHIDWTWFPAFFIGWALQDIAHEIADVVVSEHKRKLRERKL